jgi:topoisomerase-4 subunit A
LIFPLEELPELPRGKGVKILSLPSKEPVELAAICAFAEGQNLKIKSGDRVMTLKPDDQNHYVGERGRRGVALPRNWRKVVRISVE